MTHNTSYPLEFLVELQHQSIFGIYVSTNNKETIISLVVVPSASEATTLKGVIK